MFSTFFPDDIVCHLEKNHTFEDNINRISSWYFFSVSAFCYNPLMNTTPTTHKFVAVLNKKIEPGKLMNALAHMAAGLSGLYEPREELRFDTYFDKDGTEHKSISDNPFIVLSADNSNQIRTLRNSLIEQGIQFTDFTSTMTVGSYVEQHERTKQTPELELEYWGVCMFGKKDEVEPLTRKFSLWK